MGNNQLDDINFGGSEWVNYGLSYGPLLTCLTVVCLTFRDQSAGVVLVLPGPCLQ